MTDYILRCITCKEEFIPAPGRYFCDSCGKIKGTLEVLYDYDKISKLNIVKNRNFDKRGSMYQFDFLLPTKAKLHLDTYVGGSPLFKFDLCGLKDVLIKYDGSNLSCSYKDRASSVAINKAIDEGNDTIICASTGNAASSLAMLNAQTTLDTYIFVPGTIPIGKRTQLEIAGAKVFAIEGMAYDEVYDFSLDMALEKGWYIRHAAINPYLLEGKKTGAFEVIVENDFVVPDYVIVSVGDGTIISSLYKGFWEFREIGITDKMPIIIGVQAEGISAIKEVYEKGKPYTPHPISGNTIADSISVGNPRDVIKACTYVERSGGYFISVTDEEILKGIVDLGLKTGIFAEPAGAVSYCGLKKLIYEGKIKESDKVCIFVTGNGLKDINAVQNMINTQTITTEEVKTRFKK